MDFNFHHAFKLSRVRLCHRQQISRVVCLLIWKPYLAPKGSVRDHNMARRQIGLGGVDS
jgi:hypothetical protein